MTDELLQIGVESETVLDVQGRLLFLGYDPGQISGHFSTQTEAAVVQYQQATGQSPTGTLDGFAVQQLREYTDAHHYGHRGHADHHDAHHGGHHAPQAMTEQELYHARVEQGLDVHTVEYGDQPSTLQSVPGTYWDSVVQTLTNVSIRAVQVAELNDKAFIRACEDFRQYGRHAVAQYQESEITGEDIAKQITRSLMDFAGIRFCRTIGDGVVKWIAETISTGLARKASNSTRSLMYDASAGKHFGDALDGMVSALEQDQATLQNDLHVAISQAFAPLYEAAKNQEPLPKADEEWVAQCYGGADTQLDEAIENLFGIPAPAKIAEMEMAVYEKLVEQFMLAMYAKDEAAKTGSQFFDRRTEGEKWNDDPERHARAAARAARATHEQQRHLRSGH